MTKSRLGAFPAATNPGGPVPPPEPSVFAPGERQPIVSVGSVQAGIRRIPAEGSRIREGRGTAVHLRMLMLRYLLDHLPPGPR